MKYGIKTIDDFQFENKVVLCRVDMNSPLKKDKSGFSDITRIKRSIPTLKELANYQAKLVVMTHQGSDVEYHNYHHTRMHAEELSRLVGQAVKYIDDVCGPAAREAIQQLAPGEILLLDNVRFMAEEMTLFETKLKLTSAEQANTQVVKKLAPLADYYICDAFAAAHRAQPTLLGFEEVLPSAMGRLFEQEYTVLNQIIQTPERPCIFVLGGAKVQDAFMMIKAVLEKGTADLVLAGGLVGNIMLLAAGIELGKTSIEFLKKRNLWDLIGVAQNILKIYRERIILPEDLAYLAASARKEVMVKDLGPVNQLFFDIGRKTVERFRDEIIAAQTIFFNGPMGIFEEKESAYGTKKVLEAIGQSPGFSVVGGGDSITAINKYGLADHFSYICTGGGALIRFLSGEELPVIKALKKGAQDKGVKRC